MGYHIDLGQISIDGYAAKLPTAYLPPSRRVLKERVGERFGHFKALGVENVKGLMQLLKSKEQNTALQKLECFKRDYLVILLRELNSMLPKPNKIRDFRGISTETVSRLEKIGIKNTAQLYPKVLTPGLRQNLAAEASVPIAEIIELTRLTDLSRIRWAGATFARMLYDLGIDSVEKVTKASPEMLHERVNKFNKEKQVYKGTIGLNDFRVFVEASKEVPLEIGY
jgi:hypothetical protein